MSGIHRHLISWAAVAVLLALARGPALAQDPPKYNPDNPVITSGPTRPAALEQSARRAADMKIMMDTQTVISNVPAYAWFHGCGPTAEGMVLGYWDSQGFGDIFSGSATSLTDEVKEGIASAEHIADYAMPYDDPPSPVLTDCSGPPQGDCHSNECVADWMGTSRSAYTLNHGWSYWSELEDGYTGYLGDVTPQYEVSVQSIKWANLSWQSFRGQIDSNRPAIFLIDSDADGNADHIVTAIGYGTKNGTNMYACYDTWYPYDEITWWAFSGMAAGREFGIYGGVFLDLNQDPPSKPINPNPTNGAANVQINTAVSWQDGGGAQGYRIYFGTNASLGAGDFKGATNSTFYKPGTLATLTPYYWRVDATNRSGVTTGDVWQFTTADLVIRYVAPNGSQTSPYTNWSTAARSIQTAITTASNGDWVVVSNGTYAQFSIPKSIRVLSVNGAGVTIVKAQTSVRCLSITTGLIDGFTFAPDFPGDSGGGIVLGGLGVVQNCRIVGGGAEQGGAIYFNGGGLARNCLIASNWCNDAGGAVYFNGGGTLENCTVTDNESLYGSSQGGGVYCNGGGQILNCIIQFNRADTGSNYYNGGTGWGYTNTCTTPAVAGDGNIAADPKFRQYSGNLHLKSSSPCVNTGTNRDWMTSAKDLDGNPRILTDRVDMGCYERDPAVVDEFALTIESEHGTATPPVGTHTNDAGAILTNSVTGLEADGSTQFVCTGWAMPGHEPASGTTNLMTMTQTNTATLTWTWRTEVEFARAAGAGGALTGDPGGWYTLGGSVTVTAVPDSGWAFGGWSGDVPEADTNSNPLVLTMDGARSITGRFVSAARTLTVESPRGEPSPPLGTCTNPLGATVTNWVVEPAPADGTQYACVGWVMIGNEPGSGSATSFVMNVTNNATLTWRWGTNAWFSAAAGPNGRVAGSAEGWYPLGGGICVTAVPDAYYHFTGWGGAVPGGQTGSAVLGFTLESRCAISANFAESQPHQCSMSTGRLATVWDADPGSLYQLQGCDNLLNPVWRNVSLVVTAGGNIVNLADTNDCGGRSFYRAIQVFP